MKLIILILLTVLLGSCQTNNTESIIQVTTPATTEIILEQHDFISKYMDIYMHKSDYIGTEISLNGILQIHEVDGTIYYNVVRYGVGICSEHAYELLGFELDLNEIAYEQDSWIKVNGYLDVYTENNIDYIIIRNATVSECEEENKYVY